MGSNEWINKAKEFAEGHKGQVQGVVDKAKGFADDHKDQVQGALDKAEDAVRSKTGGKYDDKIDKGREMLRDKLGIPEHDGGDASAGDPSDPRPEGTDEPGQG